MRYELVIKGGYGLTNFGDDALMYVLALKLKPYFNEDQIVFSSYDNNYTEKFLNGFNSVPIENFEAIKTKILVYGGGTQFYSFLPKRTKVRVFLSKVKQFLLLKKNILDKKEIGYKKSASLGIGVGPFLKDADTQPEIDAEKAFSKMSFIATRDIYSSNKMKEWNINNCKEYSDICFLLENDNYINTSKNVKNVGIIVRDWDLTEEGKSYYSKISKLTEQLEKDNFSVTLILFAKKSDKYWNKEKDKFKHVLEWDPYTMTIDEFTKNLSKFDIFVTARYHGAIFSTLLNKPFISIQVEQKLTLISNIFKNGSEKWEYPFNTDDCLNKIYKIDNAYSNYVDNVLIKTQEQKKLAHNMIEEFIDFTETNQEKGKGNIK